MVLAPHGLLLRLVKAGRLGQPVVGHRKNMVRQKLGSVGRFWPVTRQVMDICRQPRRVGVGGY